MPKDGFYHLHRRKRVHKKLETYPHKNKWVRTLDCFLVVIALIGPIFDLPQIYKIYTAKNAIGVSFLSWLAYGLICIPWIVYGVVHKEKPIIIAYTLWLFTDLAVVIGTLLYGNII